MNDVEEDLKKISALCTESGGGGAEGWRERI